MTPTEFRRIRKKLGLTQAELSALLGYGNAVRVSEFERATNPVPVPRLLAIVMEALDGGFWPHDWPRQPPPQPSIQAGELSNENLESSRTFRELSNLRLEN